jgi:hypothetical protein
MVEVKHNLSVNGHWEGESILCEQAMGGGMTTRGMSLRGGDSEAFWLRSAERRCKIAQPFQLAFYEHGETTGQ